MDKQTEYEIIDYLVTIGYYWMSAENPSCALTVHHLLTQLDVNDKKLLKRIDGLKSDCNNVRLQSDASVVSNMNNFQKLYIPESYKADSETKLLWVTTQVILNIFNCGDFEMGYTFLMELSQTWNLLYFNVIGILKKCDIKEELCDWLLCHTAMAADLLEETEMTLAGYKITKI